MKAINWTSFEEHGCINCGCDFCYNDNGIAINNNFIATCGECKTKFLVLSDNVNRSMIGCYTGKQDENGEDIFEYPFVEEHPRKGIPKHKFVNPDVRPENGVGDFCIPRGVGYDLACFVRSKEAGQRITDMINDMAKEAKNNAFTCQLDYREHEPLWIQVKIAYKSSVRATILAHLIHSNGNIITKSVVKEAMEKEIDFPTFYEFAVKNIIAVNSMESFRKLINYPGNLTNCERKKAYDDLLYSGNPLDQFELFGASKQIELELKKGNVKLAVEILKNVVNSYPDFKNFSKPSKKLVFSEQCRDDLQQLLIKAINVYYITTDQQEKCITEIVSDSQSVDMRLFDEKKTIEFVQDWERLKHLILGTIDLKAIKNIASPSESTTSTNAFDGTSYLYPSCCLLGLVVYGKNEIERGNKLNIVLAINHVAKHYTEDLFSLLQQESKNNDMHFLLLQFAYAEVINMAKKYGSVEPQIKDPIKFVHKLTE